MNPEKQCSLSSCGQAATTSLEGEAFCRNHFISACYDKLDRYEGMRKGPGLNVSESESARRFIQECTRWADEMEHAAQDLDNLDRAKLLYIILTASELGRHLRRSPRKAASIPVKLISEKLGSSWEEETETVLVSKHGALVRCNHPAKAGETLHFKRADTGQEVLARVAWQRPSAGNDLRVGVEFVACENFWGLDWGAIEEGL